MISRREFVALLGALPAVRLLGTLRIGCAHQMVPFKTGRSIGPLREWLKGHQCEDCGHIKVEERVTIRWGGILPEPRQWLRFQPRIDGDEYE